MQAQSLIVSRNLCNFCVFKVQGYFFFQLWKVQEASFFCVFFLFGDFFSFACRCFKKHSVEEVQNFFSDGWWAPLDLNLTLQASNANTPSNSLWSSWPILCFYMSAVNTYHHCRNSVVYKDISPLKEFSNTFCLVTTLNKKGFCSVAWKEFQIVEHSMSEIPPLPSHLLHSWKLQITNIC